MDFKEECYSVLRKVPRGKVTTYGALACAVGCPGGARAAGNAMNKNQYAPQVPGHRVVRSDGKVGGFASGSTTRIKMLEAEGVEVERGKWMKKNKINFRVHPLRTFDKMRSRHLFKSPKVDLSKFLYRF